MTGCIFHDDNGVQCERDPGHKGKHAYDLAMGGQHQWMGGLVPAARIAELGRAAATSRAEGAAALGLATARIRELEGERDEALALLRVGDSHGDLCWAAAAGDDDVDDECAGAHDDVGNDVDGQCWEHRRRAIVARIEKAAKGTT